MLVGTVGLSCHALGYKIVVTTMEYRAIELVAKLDPAGIVCDMDLPHADVVELTQRIKATPAGTRAVLVLIGDGIPADGHAADALLRQPVDPLDVVSLIGAPARGAARP